MQIWQLRNELTKYNQNAHIVIKGKKKLFTPKTIHCNDHYECLCSNQGDMDNIQIIIELDDVHQEY